MIHSQEPIVKNNRTKFSQNASSAKDTKIISSQALFCDAQLVEIHHGAEIYQLRLTKTGKMLLTK